MARRESTHGVYEATSSELGLMSASDKAKLDALVDAAEIYTHPTGDGSLHVPATSTTNNGKVLTAGATAGALTWTTPSNAGVLTADELARLTVLLTGGTEGQLLRVKANGTLEWYTPA
jgi:hypothetical protein